MVFIRYLKHSKEYVMYKEHPNSGMIEINSRNVDFLEYEFTSIDEIKKDVKLYELQQDIQSSLGEWDDLNSHWVTEDGTTSLCNRNVGGLSA